MNAFLWSLTLPLLVSGQLAGSVGPLTSFSAKAQTKTCNVQSYGGVADNSTDVGTALQSAWEACADGGVVYFPPGDYAMDTWVTLTGGKAVAIQLDGIIYRTGSDGGNMIMIEHTSDFELFSSTSRGAIQGFGYEFHAEGSLDGPRILRLYEVSDFSVHDVALVDAPAFHFSMDTCSNGEVYNMAIRGGDSGGLDGIDVWSTNMWIHDVEVTNKDECVTVKSPAKNILVENIYCNWSGGCAMGSLGEDTDISDILYRNIYTWSSNQMYMIKSNGGSGTVSNVVLENFIGHGNAYSLDIDGYWSSMDTSDGDGVQLNNITVRNWRGTEEDGAERGPIKVVCSDTAPCTDVNIRNFAMWTESGDEQTYTCQSAYGSGYCLQDGDDTASYSTTLTATAAPSAYQAPRMAADLSTAFGTDMPIPIPTIPTSFFPGARPYSALAGAGSSSSVIPSSTPVSTPVVGTTYPNLHRHRREH
ncbi:pectin lyase fold/virulence factor [Aspergillus ambiguus]|uniref:pectin lyase fold/virulence factor n=1 Tax=Aspergillus ambiguus TaxID=176160 RepID=UPI003CCCD127